MLLLEMLAHLDDYAGWLVAIAAGIGVLLAFFRWVRPKWRATKQDVRLVRDTLVGREAVHDSMTGEIIAEALPGVGARMAHQEAETSEIKTLVGNLAASVEQLVDLRDELADLRGRVYRIEDFVGLERIAAKAEHVQLLRTMEAVATGAEPTHDAPPAPRPDVDDAGPDAGQ